ncbi:hypothetical protein TBS_34320 [Thermobispora bispora]
MGPPDPVARGNAGPARGRAFRPRIGREACPRTVARTALRRGRPYRTGAGPGVPGSRPRPAATRRRPCATPAEAAPPAGDGQNMRRSIRAAVRASRSICSGVSVASLWLRIHRATLRG